MSGGTPKGRSKGGDSAARGRRMADKARGPRPERPRPERLEPDDSADIGGEARIAAGLLLNGALIRRGGLDEALALPAVSNLPGPDRAFARAVAMAALRRLGEIDQILNHRLQKSPPEAVRTILRIALAQTLVLETPAFAAVSTAVKLAERDPKTRPYKNLVNAVLRGIGREGPGLTPDLWRRGPGRPGPRRTRGAADRPDPQARRERRGPGGAGRGRRPARRLGAYRSPR